MPGRRSWLRLAGGVLVIAALLHVVGADAFLAGMRALDARLAGAALAITVLTTACCAWRWQLVVRGLGAELGLGAAIGAYYRSQFLDATLPGGVLGDVYRALRRGARVGQIAQGVRSVVWERVLGQVAQLLLAGLLLSWLPSPVRDAMPAVATACMLGGLAAYAWLRAGRRFREQRVRARFGAAWRGFGVWRALGVAAASGLALAGYVTIFMLAAHAVGVDWAWSRLMPLALLALVASAVPFNVAGFGPREGAAAWVFASAGSSAEAGVAAATLYGILGLLAVTPGIVLLACDLLGPARAR